MGGAVGVIVSAVIGAVLAVAAAVAVPSVINGNPQPISEPVVVYGSAT
jgi:hypothetical protein